VQASGLTFLSPAGTADAALLHPAVAGTDPLVFYDISSPLQPPRSYAPNPSKSRLALSFKRVPFKTTWVDILDISDVRKGLNCPPVRKFADGSDYYTLPMLKVRYVAVIAACMHSLSQL
jgi:hypothetical protein